MYFNAFCNYCSFIISEKCVVTPFLTSFRILISLTKTFCSRIVINCAKMPLYSETTSLNKPFLLLAQYPISKVIILY